MLTGCQAAQHKWIPQGRIGESEQPASSCTLRTLLDRSSMVMVLARR